MRPSRRYSRVLVVAFLALGLGACGDNNDSNDNGGFTPQTPGDTFALTSTNRLLSFNRSVPGTLRTRASITGLSAGDQLVGVDFRPADGLLYGLGSSGRIYTLNIDTGVATPGATLSTALSGTSFGVDFNPVPDRLRIVSNTGQNLRVNVADGSAITDGALNTSGITAAGYTNNFAAACRTTLFYLGGAQLFTTSAPNDGVLTPVGAAATPASTPGSLEIATSATGENSAFAAVVTSGNVQLLTSVNLSTGAQTTVGPIDGLNSGETVLGLAIAPLASTPVQAAGELYGVTETNRLISFNRAAPAKLCTSAPITPLNAGENVVGIDFRPSTGVLHALANANGTARLLTLDPATGVASAPAPISVALVGTDFGMDFNPTGPVALRLVSNSGQNLRVTDIGTGATTADSALNGAGTGATAAGYTDSVAGAGTTTLYVIDTANDRLRIQNPPNAGTLVDVGALGMDFSAVNGFDIDGRDNVALLAGVIGTAAASTLHTVNLATGAVSASLGSIGGGERLRGLARPTPVTAVFGLTNANALVQVPISAPGTVTTVGTITGLGSENLVGIDFRPSTRVLYGVGSGGGLFTIDPVTAAATRLALSADATDTSDPFTALAGNGFGVDFNPMPATVPLRVVSDAEQNLRVANIATGATFTDTALTRSTAAGSTFAISAVAYTNSVTPNPASTVLYGLDAASSRLVAINAPNAGVVRVIGPTTGGTVTANSAFEIIGPSATGAPGTALAVFDTVGARTLFSIDLVTGVSTAVGVVNTPDAILGLAAPISAAAPAANSIVFAVDSTPSLIAFARNTPGTLTLDVPLSGLGTGETVVGIDFRSLDGLLYALTRDAANAARLYTVSTASGAATLIGRLVADPADTGGDGTPAFTTLAGTSFGMDFNPMPATVPLRVVSNTGQNLRVTNLTTLTTFTDTALGQPTPDVHAAAYTNSVTPSPASTQLFVIDAVTGSLLLQNPPNDGLLANVGALSASDSFSTLSGFDIAGGANGVVLAALQRVVAGTPETASRLYRINLATGAATEIGAIGGAPLRGLAVRIQ